MLPKAITEILSRWEPILKLDNPEPLTVNAINVILDNDLPYLFDRILPANPKDIPENKQEIMDEIVKAVFPQLKILLPKLFDDYATGNYTKNKMGLWPIFKYLNKMLPYLPDDEKNELLKICFTYLSFDIYSRSAAEAQRILFNEKSSSAFVLPGYIDILLTMPLNALLYQHIFWYAQTFLNEIRPDLAIIFKTLNAHKNVIENLNMTTSLAVIQQTLKSLEEKRINPNKNSKDFKKGQEDQLILKIIDSLQASLLTNTAALLPGLFEQHHTKSASALLNLLNESLKGKYCTIQDYNAVLQVINKDFPGYVKKNVKLFESIYQNGFISQESIQHRLNFLKITKQWAADNFLKLCPTLVGHKPVHELSFEQLQFIIDGFMQFQQRPVYPKKTYEVNFYQYAIQKFFDEFKKADDSKLKQNLDRLEKILNLEDNNHKLKFLLNFVNNSSSQANKKILFDLIVPKLSQLNPNQQKLLLQLYAANSEDSLMQEKQQLANLLLQYYDETHDKFQSQNTNAYQILQLANKINNREVDFLVLSFSPNAFNTLRNIKLQLDEVQKTGIKPENVTFLSRISSYVTNKEITPSEKEKINNYFCDFYKAQLFYQIAKAHRLSGNSAAFFTPEEIFYKRELDEWGNVIKKEKSEIAKILSPKKRNDINFMELVTKINNAKTLDNLNNLLMIILPEMSKVNKDFQTELGNLRNQISSLLMQKNYNTSIGMTSSERKVEVSSFPTESTDIEEIFLGERSDNNAASAPPPEEFPEENLSGDYSPSAPPSDEELEENLSDNVPPFAPHRDELSQDRRTPEAYVKPDEALNPQYKDHQPSAPPDSTLLSQHSFLNQNANRSNQTPKKEEVTTHTPPKKTQG